MEEATKGKVKRRHLNADECRELGRGGAGGPSVLSQPRSLDHPPPHDARGPPRTPTKKKKLESPFKEQKSISDFFLVTGVVRSSPQKAPPTSPPGSASSSSSSSSSAHAAGRSRESNPARPAESRAEHAYGDMDDDADDISLLAALAEEHPEVEKEEEEEEEEIDYLEGITPDMFDKSLVERSVWNAAAARDSKQGGRELLLEEEEEEEGVEPLPDGHYGLLGSGAAGLLVPRGRLQDLPEEVLRQILLLLPARDLYRCVAPVCTSWRSIVQDPKFAPYKKQYFRYSMGEEGTVAEVTSILEGGGVLDKSVPQESVRRLVSLMAQHTPGERLSPGDLMRCIEGHRLCPLALSCLALRFPHLLRQAPNPYAAMAIILVLSEAVSDVQALVCRLADRMSRVAVVEFLSHMATYLLAMTQNNVRISNRLHYNIFYVLHLMHSSTSPASAAGGERRYHVTHEQQQILSHDIQPDHVVKVMAFAGTGKTSTLVRLAEERPDLRFLYVAFNKSVASEAQRRFPGNVVCKTVHSIAYADVGKQYQLRGKLQSNLKVFSVARVLPVGRGGYIHAKVVTTTLNAYMASVDRHLCANHVPDSFKNNRGQTQMLDHCGKMEYVKDCEEIWRKMKDLNKEGTRKDAFFMTHDGYLKLWQLQEPKPCLWDQYDVIFIDEAQDCTPAIMDVLLAQRCAKVLVGDPHQQIYTFRGAVNALHTTRHTHIFYLTQSFRFGAEIAYVGATILQVCKNVRKILVGGNQEGSVYGESFDPVARVPLAPSHTPGPAPAHGPAPGTTAILSRCNFGVFNEAVRLTDRNPGCRICFIGGVVGVGLSKILDIWLLKQPLHNRSAAIEDPFLRSFGGYASLQKYVLQSEDRELEAKVAVVERYAHRVPELVNRLRACHQGELRHADFILGTVHKAKGLEFDTVMVCDDFARVPCARHHLGQHFGFCCKNVPQDEWNLLYVAVTRARCHLVMTRNIRNILTLAGEYFLRAEVTGSLQREGLPPRCSASQCLHTVRGDAPFTMCKRPLKYTDGVSPGGPLCERCVWQRAGAVATLMSDEALTASVRPDHGLIL